MLQETNISFYFAIFNSIHKLINFNHVPIVLTYLSVEVGRINWLHQNKEVYM